MRELAAPAAARIARLRAEHRPPGTALGLGTAAPRLSWQVRTDRPGWVQSSYELQLLDDDGGVSESTGEVPSAEQLCVRWPFDPLRSREGRVVRVRATAVDGTATAWSDGALLEAGLLAPHDWVARPVTGDPDAAHLAPGSAPGPAPRVRREFAVGPGLLRARLHVTALGTHETWINGRPVSDEVLAPGWTSYAHRLRYRTHDVTALLREGQNAIASLLGNGWYRGRMAWSGARAHYGTRRSLLAQLELHYEDGGEDLVATDEQWRWSPSHVLSDDLYDGQEVDLRRVERGWSEPGHDAAGWAAVDVLPQDSFDAAVLVAADGPPVRALRTVPAVSVVRPPDGGVLVDFGENVVGRVRLRARGERGARVVVRHAEVLDDGRLAVRPLRSARATDTYHLAGGEEVLDAALTLHGFRYAEVRGLAGLAAEDVEAVVVGSDLEPAGTFTCSEPDVVALHENVRRSMQGNFVDVPTDCPQRDERLGWTGDIQVFSPTALFLADAGGFLVSWLKDLAADQAADGAVPFVVPDVLPGPVLPAAAWGDAATVVPSVVFERSGDRGVLEDQWDSMVAWVERILAAAGDDLLWTGGFQFGDWLDPTAPPDDAAAAQADPDVVASAHVVRSTALLARAARSLGRQEAADRYGALAERARRAFVAEYVTAGGRVLSDCPTVYALALAWDLVVEPEQRRRAGERLADLVRASGFRISTGFVGTPLVADALTATGRADLAYRLLLQRSCPSWLYPVTMGATTVWERWDSMLPDGSVNPGEMTSFNHYALGAVADWLHRTVAGLAPAAPGYRRVLVAPVPGGGLTSASARHASPYGPVSVDWRVEGGSWHLALAVPPGATAEVHLPDGSVPLDVPSGRHAWTLPWPPQAARPPEVTMDSPVRHLLDEPRAWAATAAALVGLGIGADEAEVAARAAPHRDGTVRDFAAAVSPRGGIPVGEPALMAVAAALDRAPTGRPAPPPTPEVRR